MSTTSPCWAVATTVTVLTLLLSLRYRRPDVILKGFRITENFKVPHLRNMVQKLGMSGFSGDSSAATGPQIRGFGFANDGSIDTLNNFFSDPVFNFCTRSDLTRPGPRSCWRWIVTCRRWSDSR